MAPSLHAPTAAGEIERRRRRRLKRHAPAIPLARHLKTHRPANRRHRAREALQRARLGTNRDLGESRLERRHAEDPPADHVQRRRRPGMVHVRHAPLFLQHEIPELHRDRRALCHHSQPAPMLGRGHQTDRLIRAAARKERVQHELRHVGAAGEALRRHIVSHGFHVLRRHHAAGERHRVALDGGMVRADAIAVASGGGIEQDALVGGERLSRLRLERLRVVGLADRARHRRQLAQVAVVERIDHGVHLGEDESVAIALSPVHDVADPPDVRQIPHRLAERGDEPVRTPQVPPRLDVLHQVVVFSHEIRLARVHPVVMDDSDEELLPFGRPRGVRGEVVGHRPHERMIRGDGVRAELRDVGVRLVGQPLAVAVNELPHVGGGADRMFAEVVHAHELRRVAREGLLRHVVGIVDRHLPDIPRADRERRAHDLQPAERHHRAERPHGLRTKHAAVARLVRHARPSPPREAVVRTSATERALLARKERVGLDRSIRVDHLAPNERIGARCRHVHLDPACRMPPEVHEQVPRRVRRNRNRRGRLAAHDPLDESVPGERAAESERRPHNATELHSSQPPARNRWTDRCHSTCTRPSGRPR